LLSFEDPAYFPMTAITASPFTLVGATGFFERDLNFYLDATETIIATSKLPPPLCLNATNLSENQRRQAIKSHFYISAMMLPSLSKPVVKEVQCTAQLRLALSAIAVERYRLALGKLPDALGDLVPKYLPSVPEDPFDGQPIRFKHVEEGYVIYSIGPDGIDDGGRERLSLGSAKAKNIKVIPDETYDITFTVER
jgi:hypothetical protein